MNNYFLEDLFHQNHASFQKIHDELEKQGKQKESSFKPSVISVAEFRN